MNFIKSLKLSILVLFLVFLVIFPGCGDINTPGIPQDSLNAVIAANPTSGEAPLEVTFDASESSSAEGNEIVSYEWDFGDEKAGEGKTVHHGFDSPGNYTVILTISDNKGAVDTSSVIIKVFNPTEASIEQNFSAQDGTELDTGTGLKIIIPPTSIEGQMNLEVKYNSNPSQSASDFIKLHSSYSISIILQKGFQKKELITSGMNKYQETTQISLIFDVPEDVDPQSLAIFEWADEGWYLAGAGDIETIGQLGGVLNPDDKYISIEVPVENSLSTPAVVNTFGLGNFIINKIDFLFAICPMESENSPENKDDYIEKKVFFQSLECEVFGSGRGIPYKVGILNNSENLIDNAEYSNWNQPYTDPYQILDPSEPSDQSTWYLMPSDDEDKKGVLTLRFGPEGGECTVWLEADGSMLLKRWLLHAIPNVDISDTVSNIFKMYIENAGDFLMGDSVDTIKLFKETKKMLDELRIELVKEGMNLIPYGKIFTSGFKIGDLIKSLGTYLVMIHHSQPSCPYKNPGYWEWKIVVPPITPETYTITASAGPNGSISPSGNVTVNQGSDKSLTITPDTDYSIADILVDGSSVGAISSYTFTNVTEDHTISATFTPSDFPQPSLTGKIAFVSDRGVRVVIYVMNADGSNQTRLTNNPSSEPCFSPDGNKIAFASWSDGEIYVMNADGSNQTRLTNNWVYDGEPCFSPDGTKIAFVSTRDGDGEIYVMNADGSNVINLTNNPAWDAEPSWGP